LNEHGVNDVRQREIHTAEPIVPELSAFEFETAIEKLKRHILPGIHQIPTELFKAGVGQFAFKSVNLLILCRIRRFCLRSWKEAVILTIYERGDKADCNFCTGLSLFNYV
jgi:hypothetical protein